MAISMLDKDFYRKSLNLPQTDFPMKAKLAQKEPEIIQHWDSNKIYKKILEKQKNQEVFFLPDGPPYANGPIHIGHALNKILKDMVVKYKNLKGFKAPFIPSWDCHGLPIELKALKSDKTKGELTHSQLRHICRKEAQLWIENQKQSFKRLGLLADWDQTLLTMDPAYEAEEVRVFAQLAKKSLLYLGSKPVFWCFKLKTALAFSEAEYREHKSPSIYVKFYLTKEAQKKLGVTAPTSAVIWTTTPWTLPANSAIALHPELDYGLYQGDKQNYLLACELVESFTQETDLNSLKQLKTFKGKDLEGLNSLHPFIPQNSPLVLGDHVSLEAGTGLVHTAPGHGLEDHLVGQKYNLPAPCPVDEKGHFTQEVPNNLQGLFIFKGNKVIIEMIKSSGHLISYKEIRHNYPYSPRSNSPLIYRSTAQWFISLDKKTKLKTNEQKDKPLKTKSQNTKNPLQDLKNSPALSLREQALKLCEKEIHFVPDWGKARLQAMLKTGPDWCLSRQRVWGVPLVVFYCKHCSQALLDPEIIEQIATQMELTGQGIEYYFL